MIGFGTNLPTFLWMLGAFFSDLSCSLQSGQYFVILEPEIRGTFGTREWPDFENPETFKPRNIHKLRLVMLAFAAVGFRGLASKHSQ